MFINKPLIIITMRQGMSLSMRQDMPMRVGGPILGLSALELELLLDQSVAQVQDFHDTNPAWKNEHPVEERGNYFFNENFRTNCKAVKDKVPRHKYLETPQVFVERGEERYSASYNTEIDRRIAEKLARFKRPGEEAPPPSKIFSKQFAKERAWIVKQQLAIVEYLCQRQEVYLQSGSPLDLEPLIQDDIAWHIGYSTTSVSRLVRNLTIQLPDEKVIFAEELIPGVMLSDKKGTYALKLLQQDSTLYDQGNWKVSDEKLVPILRDRFNLYIARRTVTKYRNELETATRSN